MITLIFVIPRSSATAESGENILYLPLLLSSEQSSSPETVTPPSDWFEGGNLWLKASDDLLPDTINNFPSFVPGWVIVQLQGDETWHSDWNEVKALTSGEAASLYYWPDSWGDPPQN